MNTLLSEFTTADALAHSEARFRMYMRHAPMAVFVLDHTGKCGVVLMITALATHLHLRTVAEGVETESQRMLLQQSGCQLAQGYLVSRSVAPEEIAALVKGQKH